MKINLKLEINIKKKSSNVRDQTQTRYIRDEMTQAK